MAGSLAPGGRDEEAVSLAVNHHPTDAQKEAGNYRKEHLSFQGLPVAIENKKGSVRSGIDPNGKRWSCVVPADYGYIKGTDGADGDQVDVYLGPDRLSKLVVLVNQVDRRTRRFDEHKCILGTGSEREALDIYCRAFSDGKGRERIGSVEVMSLDGFKHWLKRGDTKRAAKRVVDMAMDRVR